MRFLGVNSSLVNLIEKKDSTNNEKTEYYSLDDIRGYKVYTALLTQSGGDDIQTFAWEYLQPIPEFPILLAGVTYYIDSNQSNTDFTIAGSPNNNSGTSFVANGTQPNWEPPFEIESNYIQIEWNTGAPVATVLENTLGGSVSFSYIDVGNYLITCSQNVFILDKTFFISTISESNADCLEIGLTRISNNQVNLLGYGILEGIISPFEIESNNFSIEIRVYN